MLNNQSIVFNQPSEFESRVHELWYYLCLKIGYFPVKGLLESCPKFSLYKTREAFDEDYPDEAGRSVSAIFDEDHNTIAFILTNFEIKETPGTIMLEKTASYIGKYSIPYSYIFHEMVHAIQFQNGVWKSNLFIEGCADIYSYLITGEVSFDYPEECYALWNFFANYMELNEIEFLILIGNLIKDKNALSSLIHSYPKYFKRKFKTTSAIRILNKSDIIIDNYGINASGESEFKCVRNMIMYLSSIRNFVKSINYSGI